MKNKTVARDGFTLLEVILAMGLSFFLLAALYQAITMQTQYGEFAAAQQRRSQIARALLGRIAAEIRSLEPPAQAVPAPVSALASRALLARGGEARPGIIPLGPEAFGVAPGASPRLGKLLHLGEGILSAGGGDGADLMQEEEGIAARDEGTPPILGTEAARLIGTSSRLLLMERRIPTTLSIVEQYQRVEESGESDVGPLGPDAGDPARSRVSNPGSDRVVLYLMRPNPDWDETANAEGDFENEETIPMYLGLVRQEIERPWSPGIELEARLQLAEILDPRERGGAAERPLAGNEADLADYVHTHVVADSVTSIRFRYHDGTMWLDEWERDGALPAAVEITVSFDPEDGFDEGHGEPWGEMADETAGAEPTEWDEIIEDDLPFRLVVPVTGARVEPAADRLGAEPPPPFARAGREEQGQ